LTNAASFGTNAPSGKTIEAPGNPLVLSSQAKGDQVSVVFVRLLREGPYGRFELDMNARIPLD
jgi:hypothetical protein